MEILFQEYPLLRNPNPVFDGPSYTESLTSYRQAARNMAWVLENNNRRPNVELVLRYHWPPISTAEIRRRWKRIRTWLTKMRIPFIAATELTKGENGRPNNCIHYYFMFDTAMNRDELKGALKLVCLASNFGIYKKDFEWVFPNKEIYNYKKKIKYFTKWERPEKIILFRKGLRIPKFSYSKDWFIDQDGKPITRRELLDRLRLEYKKRKGFV